MAGAIAKAPLEEKTGPNSTVGTLGHAIGADQGAWRLIAPITMK
jgi:hypothetical protein